MKPIYIICILTLLATVATAREELYMSGCEPPYRVILQFDNETFCCIDLDKNDQCDYPVITYRDANNKTVIRYDPVINKTPLPGMILQPVTTSTLRITTTVPALPTTIGSTNPTIPSTPTTIGIQVTSSTQTSTQQTTPPSTSQITTSSIRTTPTTMYNVRPMPTTTTLPDIIKTITNTVTAKDPSGIYTIIAIAFFVVIVIATVLYTLGSESD